MKTKTEEVRSALGQLAVGDTRDKAEAVLTKAGLVHVFDQSQNRYQSTVTDLKCNPYAAVSIYINFDLYGKVSKIEVIETFTGP